MKQLSIGLNILALVLIGILFYLHFDGKTKPAKTVAVSNATGNNNSNVSVATTKNRLL